MNINPIYKLDNGGLQFTSNSFAAKPLRGSNRNDGAWIVAYREEAKRQFEAVVSTQRFHEYEVYELENERQKLPERRILSNKDYLRSETLPGVRMLDGFYLMQLYCIEDPSDVSTLNLEGKDLNHIKEEDMTLFDNVVEIYASENNLNFDGFKNFPKLKILVLSCNNLKTIHLKHEDFKFLENLDLSYNHLNANDIAHLGVLQNIKILKLSGNNLRYLPDTFSKSYVSTNEKNEKIVAEKFPKLEELHLDHNNLSEENSFDVLAILKKLKKLYLNNNQIYSIPYLKIVGQDHVIQEFAKIYYQNKADERKRSSGSDDRKVKDLPLLHDTKTRENPNVKMAADLDLHKSNALRNSFILEEDEENEQNESNLEPINESSENVTQRKLFHPADHADKPVSLPFSELSFVDLSNNLLDEEENLIALASWPMLTEVVLFGNPIVYKNIGYTPLIKKFLVDRLGINVQRVKPLKPLKVPVAVPMKEHRKVETNVVKVPKVPLEVRMMLTYPEQYNHTDSFFETENYDSTNKSQTTKKGAVKSEDYNSFFMTQAETNEEISDETRKSTEDQSSKLKDNSMSLNHSLDGFELLFNIENEDQINIPKDMSGCVRALRNILDHPLVFRDACLDLEKPQKPYDPKPKKVMPEAPKLKPRIEEVNKIIDSIRERSVVEEKSLNKALHSKNKKDYELAKKLLGEVQSKYNQVRYDSLRQAESQKLSLNNTIKEVEKMKLGSANNKKKTTK